jgi:5-methyltetrahydrofolate--homocysteine methyltransferase
MLQASDATVDDFESYEGCNEILNVTRPDIVTGVHEAYLEAGADCVTTNSFGANLGNLGEYGIAERIAELSEASARLARAAADRWATPDRPRWVLGSMGPGTKLPTLGHTTFRELRDTYQVNAEGLLRGGADALIIETCQDLLQAKAAIVGARRAVAELAPDALIIAQVTIETTGTMLLGTEIGAALTALEPLGIDMLGLNCATGPGEMSEHLRYLAAHARIPDLLRAERRPARPHLGRRELPADPGPARGCPRQVHQGVRPVPGGRVLRHHPGAHRRAGGPGRGPPGRRAQAAARAWCGVALPARAVPAGHRVPDHRRADQRQRVQGVPRSHARGQVRGLRGIARAQTRDGAHLLDVCVDYVGRDGVADMREIVARFATAATLPLVLDST